MQYWEICHTPRTLMQMLGTDGGRNIVHPNIWVNGLMSEYRAKSLKDNPQLNVADYSNSEFPNWIITDVRFPNEAAAVKKREGVLLRIYKPGNRKCRSCGKTELEHFRFAQGIGMFDKYRHPFIPDKIEEHESETALDNYKEFDYIIFNHGTKEDLLNALIVFLTKFKFIGNVR